MRYLIFLATLTFVMMVVMTDRLPVCCKVCSDDKIKTYSVDAPHGHCAESCIPPNKFDLYKLFERNLTRSKTNNETSCANNGYAAYWMTEEHGIPRILQVEVDMYNHTHGKTNDLIVKYLIEGNGLPVIGK
jgi:hypothetical protein